MSTERIPYLLGYHEIAQLFRVARDAPLLWRKRSLLGDPDLIVSGSPYWLLPTVLALTNSGYRQIEPQALDDYKAGIPGGYVASGMDQLPILIGIQEVSWVFNKTPTAISQWRNRGTLPSPNLALSGSPLWTLESILADASQRNRPMSGEAIARIRAGERAQPRRRRRADSQADESETAPAVQTFTCDENSAAADFLENVLRAGYNVEIRPFS
ncbi:hypothetical protein ITP53_04015 [Nonomuraea sp. K274]|uniref:Uncharacterized protein n=1 Tax=Nonomuraea cypriaca TaxID=1187855 RepID=A0A931A2A8_9ACTN|nr:hypothetical protein [Nonomuraea cypriaca]MBF8184917.1 hypothetical protein [Nonomuraea cypriaca]